MEPHQRFAAFQQPRAVDGDESSVTVGHGDVDGVKEAVVVIGRQRGVDACPSRVTDFLVLDDLQSAAADDRRWHPAIRPQARDVALMECTTERVGVFAHPRCDLSFRLGGRIV